MPCLDTIMKRLLIMRHAKSSWEKPELADIDRPLNDRGLRAAPFMGGLLRRLDLIPDCIVSSPAKRAIETAKLVRQAGGFDPQPQPDERVYEASANMLRQVVSETHPICSTALLVGHNPGMEGFIRYLTGQTESMPTGAVAFIELDIDEWSKVDEGVGHLRKLYRPKHEMEEQAKHSF